jgi:SAM-dependent methyltransferase
MWGSEHERQRESWDGLAEGWAERVRTGTDHNRVHLLDPAMLGILGDVTRQRVLDAGCGEGRFARMLAERGAKVTGIDLSPRMVELACEQEEREPLGIEYQEADMADLSAFADGAFDLAVAYNSLMDVPAYEAAVAEVARVLKAGGRFVFCIIHPCFWMPGAQWEPRKPGSFPLRDGDKLYLKVDHYFPAREVRFKMWPTAPVETVNYHRPLSDYAHACRDAGLLIRDIVEPTPDPDLAERLDFWKAQFRAPGFVIFECVRAGDGK